MNERETFENPGSFFISAFSSFLLLYFLFLSILRTEKSEGLSDALEKRLYRRYIKYDRSFFSSCVLYPYMMNLFIICFSCCVSVCSWYRKQNGNIAELMEVRLASKDGQDCHQDSKFTTLSCGASITSAIDGTK